MKSVFRFTVWALSLCLLSYPLVTMTPLLLAAEDQAAQEQATTPNNATPTEATPTNTTSTNTASTNSSTKPELDVRAGVWNNGQAAIWDLDIIDHYRFSGFPERARGYKPEQPINFSHKLHVGDLKMECQFCHWTVDKSAFAAIPEEETCMGCHGVLVSKQSPEIDKLKKYWADGEPVPWEKVHVMPDHVQFNHKRHVKAGVTCQECHGQVPQMEVVERASSMKMGWCLDCHRGRGTSIDCSVCHK